MLTLTLIMIAMVYYFYVFVSKSILIIKWYLIPYIDSSETGFSLDLKTNWKDTTYRQGMLIFIVYHFLLTLLLLSLLRSIFNNPGYYDDEYVNLYSLIKFIKHIFIYFIKWKDSDFKFDSIFLNDTASLKEDLTEIVKKIEPSITEKMIDISHSMTYISKYNSIDVTKKSIFAEIEDFQDARDKQTISQTFNEDVLDSFESELENFIKSHPFYEMLNNLPFMEKGKDKYSRFCGFCLTKKVKDNNKAFI